MANGYLGKISAVVSANTSDFSAKLNSASSEVARFAKTVESNIGSAMRAANKSLADIYTPLQKFERSLQAARDLKLSFRGFPGAVRDVESLRARLAELQKAGNDRQIGIFLKTFGFKDLTAARDAIGNLSGKEISLVAKVGGIEQIKKLEELTTEQIGRAHV